MRAIITVGLGFGDEGKGSVVDFLVRATGAKLVARYNGGHQAAHNVVTPDGKHHTFSQFGAGTLAGAGTYLGRHVIIEPLAMIKEAEHLIDLTGVNPCANLIVHESALVTTPWHKLLNQIKEFSRGSNLHGSCGVGIGETRKYWLDYGVDSLFASDLLNHDVLVEKLEMARQRLLIQANSYCRTSLPSYPSIIDLVKKMYDIDAPNVAHLIKRAVYRGACLHQTNGLPPCDTVIFEGAQGVLLDENYGFSPYTTWSTTTSRHAFEELAGRGASDVKVLGITRAHMSRHGAGPMPTYDSALTAKDKRNPWNPWQHDMRFGYLDIPLIKYAYEADGRIDGLFVTHLDQPAEFNKICVEYNGGVEPAVVPCPNAQDSNTLLLERVKPEYTDQLTPLEALRLVGPIYGQSWGDNYTNKKEAIKL